MLNPFNARIGGGFPIRNGRNLNIINIQNNTKSHFLQSNENELVSIDHTFIKTQTFGLNHPDTISFNDVDIFRKLNLKELQNIKISKIKVWSGNSVNGIQIGWKTPHDELIWGKEHLGNHGEYTEKTYSFEKDEEIVEIGGSIGSFMDNLIIWTNKRVFTFGTIKQSRTFQIRIPRNCQVLGLCGGIGGHIHNIGLLYTPIKEWNPSVHQHFSSNFHNIVKTLLIMNAKKDDGKPYHDESHFYKLPKDILYNIIQNIATVELKHDRVKYSIIENKETNYDQLRQSPIQTPTK